jgi:hypothetical protein
MLRRFVPKRTRQFTSSVPLLAGFRVANSEQLSTLADFGPQPKCFLASLVIHKAAWISACLAQPVEIGTSSSSFDLTLLQVGLSPTQRVSNHRRFFLGAGSIDEWMCR